MVYIIVLWNSFYITAPVEGLKHHGYPVLDEDLARLSPLIFEHINMLGRYIFAALGEPQPVRHQYEGCEDNQDAVLKKPLWV